MSGNQNSSRGFILLSLLWMATPIVSILLQVRADAANDGVEPPQWVPVKDFKPVEPGEHPRLFFRRSDVPEIRKRAETPEGRKIIERLRFVLNGGDGETLPQFFNPSRLSVNNSATPVDPGKPPAVADLDAASRDEDAGDDGITTNKTKKAGDFVNVDELPIGKAYTLWHAAGYGMLWQVTGNRKYADLGRECVQKALDGQRDRDNRYSFIDANGALRAGPSLGAIAMGYDLCYDGWDEDFRRKVADAIARYDQGPFENIDDLARGARHYPGKNHWGGQVGGAALALLAVWKDPGVDSARIERLMETNSVCMFRHLTDGFGPWGFYSEAQGPGGIASDTAYIPGIQAWRVAGGRDFVTPRTHVSYITVLKVHELVLVKGSPWYTLRCPSGYGSGNFAPRPVDGMQSDLDGLSRGGQFAQGFGAVQEKYKPALLWVYNEIVERDPTSRTFDTVSPYPHRAALSLVNWPIGMEAVNPASILPLVHDDPTKGYLVARNQWKDGTDIVVTMKIPAGPRENPIMVWGCDLRLEFANSPGPTRPYYRTANDGSVIVSNTKGETYVAVDFSKASGAEVLVANIGRYARAGKNVTAPSGASAKFHTMAAGGYKNIVILTVQTNAPPVPRVDGDAVIVGGQTVRFDGRRFLLGKMADGPPERTFASDFVYTPEREQKHADDVKRLAGERVEMEKERLRQIEKRFAEAEKLLSEKKFESAMAIAEELVKSFQPPSPYLDRANALVQKINERLLEGN